jgi:hypothetical protein
MRQKKKPAYVLKVEERESVSQSGHGLQNDEGGGSCPHESESENGGGNEDGGGKVKSGGRVKSGGEVKSGGRVNVCGMGIDGGSENDGGAEGERADQQARSRPS